MNFKVLSVLSTISISFGMLIWLYSAKNIYGTSSQNILIDVPHRNSNLNTQSAKFAESHTVPSKQIDVMSHAKNKPLDKNLIENWDLTELNISAETLMPFLQDSQPESIVYFGNDVIKRIYPKKYAMGSAQSDKILFLSNYASIQKIVQSKLAQETTAQMDNGHEKQLSDHNGTSYNTLLPNYAYDIVSFSPGTRHDGSVLVPVAENYRAALNGPDYAFDNFAKSDDMQMIRHLSTVLPLGNDGMLVLQIRDGGTILSKGGPDFTVYQTTFRIDSETFWQKIARLGVSETLNPKDVRWFPCDPKSGDIKNCVGAVPTDEGGDQFSLADIGVSQARYIWIKDIGYNFDIRSKWPTEGCALDALRIYHAYIAK